MTHKSLSTGEFVDQGVGGQEAGVKAGLKIGILGGSFNPPHAGHLYLAEQARNLLNLDEVWLLPVPLSTLKQAQDVAPFSERLALCELLAAPYSWLHAKPFETDIGTNETLDTVTYLRNHFPAHDIMWLMGADSFAGVHTWGPSSEFIKHIKTAVFSRSEVENDAALNSITAQNMQRISQSSFTTAVSGWCFWEIPMHPGRATDIRARLNAEEKPDYISDEMWQELRGSGFYAEP